MSEVMMSRLKNADEKFCSECASTIKAKAEICPKCGVRQMTQQGFLTAAAPNGKNKITAAFLAFFLGGLGVHKFYLGQIGFGFLYLIFSWTLIPSIVAFIEFIILLTMTDETFNNKHGSL